MRHTSQFMVFPVDSVYNRTKYASCLGPKIWELICSKIKANESLAGFNKHIKKCKPNDCPYRLCKVSMNNFGFI